METITLYEGVLNDDTLTINNEEKVLKVQIEYYLYATPNSNTKKVIYFDSFDEAIEWYKNNFKERVIKQGESYIKEEYEEEDCIYTISNNEAIDEWCNIIDALIID